MFERTRAKRVQASELEIQRVIRISVGSQYQSAIDKWTVPAAQKVDAWMLGQSLPSSYERVVQAAYNQDGAVVALGVILTIELRMRQEIVRTGFTRCSIRNMETQFANAAAHIAPLVFSIRDEAQRGQDPRVAGDPHRPNTPSPAEADDFAEASGPPSTRTTSRNGGDSDSDSDSDDMIWIAQVAQMARIANRPKPDLELQREFTMFCVIFLEQLPWQNAADPAFNPVADEIAVELLRHYVTTTELPLRSVEDWAYWIMSVLAAFVSPKPILPNLSPNDIIELKAASDKLIHSVTALAQSVGIVLSGGLVDHLTWSGLVSSVTLQRWLLFGQDPTERLNVAPNGFVSGEETVDPADASEDPDPPDDMSWYDSALRMGTVRETDSSHAELRQSLLPQLVKLAPTFVEQDLSPDDLALVADVAAISMLQSYVESAVTPLRSVVDWGRVASMCVSNAAIVAQQLMDLDDHDFDHMMKAYEALLDSLLGLVMLLKSSEPGATEIPKPGNHIELRQQVSMTRVLVSRRK